MLNSLLEWINNIVSWLVSSGGSAQAGQKNDTLFASLVLLAISGFAYVAKSIIASIAAFIARNVERRQKLRAALIRYVYDVEIAARDFKANYDLKTCEKNCERIISGKKDFRFSYSSTRNEDAPPIMDVIHWLTSPEIFAVRLCITYGQLFEEMLKALSTELFATYDKERKIDLLLDAIVVGLEYHNYCNFSLASLRAPSFAGARRKYLDIPKGYLEPSTEDRRCTLRSLLRFFGFGKIPDNGLKRQELEQLRIDSKRRLKELNGTRPEPIETIYEDDRDR